MQRQMLPSMLQSPAALLYCFVRRPTAVPTILQLCDLRGTILNVTSVQQDHHDKTLEALKHAKKAHLHAMQAQASLKNAQEAQKKAETAQRRKQEVSPPALFHVSLYANGQ